MPSHRAGRPLKTWRYVGVFGPELMVCVGLVRIGRARQSFWAVWDRETGRLWERTALGGGGVTLAPGRVAVRGRQVAIDIRLDEAAGVETVCPSGPAYAWTRKQAGIRARGTVALPGGDVRFVRARAVVDDTAAYYARHTRWRWSAGVGIGDHGSELAWNLVDGVNDPAVGSERTVWVDGRPGEVAPVRFEADLSGVGELRFAAEAERTRTENLVVVRSRYRQPFGTFSGSLPDGSALREGWGVMEDHEVWW
jgi:uncharacterized protein DUF2804